VLFAAILAVVCTTGAAAGPVEEADSAYQQGEDYVLAAQLFRALAEQGHARAQFNLGVLYAEGKGVPQDYPAALKWYRKAAKQGHVQAQYNLGVLSYDGQGIKRDYRAARQWFHQAAEQGFAPAQYNLGVMYVRGQGGPPDVVRAHLWSSLAAAALSGDDEQMALQVRDRATARMTAGQIEKAEEMARRCQETTFKECE
jgi:TPR repeat protein